MTEVSKPNRKFTNKCKVCGCKAVNELCYAHGKQQAANNANHIRYRSTPEGRAKEAEYEVTHKAQRCEYQRQYRLKKRLINRLLEKTIESISLDDGYIEPREE